MLNAHDVFTTTNTAMTTSLTTTTTPKGVYQSIQSHHVKRKCPEPDAEMALHLSTDLGTFKLNV